MSPNLEKFFETHSIQYKLYTHPPLFTCEDAQKAGLKMEGIDAKSLLLREKGGEKFYLVLLPFNVRMDVKAFTGNVGAKKLSFASSEELMNVLGLIPGSVSPFGLINDVEHKVTLYIHPDIWNAPKVTFHPNINTETVEMTKDEFERCLKLVGVEYRMIT